MATNVVQTTGTVKFGISSANVDVSADVYSAIFTRTSNMVTKPATWGSMRETQVPGSYSEEIAVEYASTSVGASAGGPLDALIAEAVFNQGGVLYFEYMPNPGAVGQTNPKFTGTCSVPSAEFGGGTGDLRRKSIVFSVLTSTGPTVA